MKKIIEIIFLIIFISLFSFSIYKICINLKDKTVEEKEIKNILEEVIINKEIINNIDESEEKNEIDLELDFGKLNSINNETVGWIKIKNTNINYPIVQTNNNEYYLNHSFDKSNNIYGWIFMNHASKSDFSDQNTIIFGHDTHSKYMFSDLKKLYDGLLGNNIGITIYTESNTYHYSVFSIFLTDENSDQYLSNYLSLNDIKEAINKSKYNFNIDVDNKDTILTLSTCYNTSKNKVILLAVQNK